MFSDLRGVVGTGIGVNRSRDDLALTVMVSDERTARRIPSQLKGVDVVVEMVGEIDAY